MHECVFYLLLCFLKLEKFHVNNWSLLLLKNKTTRFTLKIRVFVQIITKKRTDKSPFSFYYKLTKEINPEVLTNAFLTPEVFQRCFLTWSNILQFWHNRFRYLVWLKFQLFVSLTLAFPYQCHSIPSVL